MTLFSILCLRSNSPHPFLFQLSVICLSLTWYRFLMVAVSCRHWPRALSRHRWPLSIYHQLHRERTQQAGLWFTWDTEVMWNSLLPAVLYPQFREERERERNTKNIPYHLPIPKMSRHYFPDIFIQYLQYTVTSSLTVFDSLGWYFKEDSRVCPLCLNSVLW